MLVSSLFRFWPLLQHFEMRLFLPFLLLFGAQCKLLLFVGAWGIPGHPSHPHYSSNILCGGHVVTTPSLWWFPPHTCLHKICPTRPLITLFALFCVCCVPMHPTAPTRTHSHTPESLLTSLCLCAHMCLLGGNFPAMHAPKAHPLNPFVSLLTSICCSSVSPNPIAPIQTHLHPSAPVRTRPHPRLDSKYVYLCSMRNACNVKKMLILSTCSNK